MRKSIINIIAMLFSLGILIAGFSQLVVPKSDIGAQVKENGLPDVLFFGTSHVKFGIHPGELWEQNGIAAYNCAANGEPMRVTEWTLRGAVEKMKPKVVVVDVYSLSVWRDIVSTEAIHTSLDWLPLGKTKWEMAEALAEPKDRAEILFPFIRFHSRWEELGKTDFVGTEMLYGNTAATGYARYYEPCDLLSQSETSGETGAPEEALYNIARYCREKGVQLVLIELPGPNSEGQQRRINAAAAIARECGLDYLDMDRMELVNKNTDYNDISQAESGEMGYHLNVSGAKKVTRWLGNYLQEHYGLPDHRGEQGYELWEKKHRLYLEEKLELAKEAENPYELLLRLKDYDISAAVVIPEMSAVREDLRLLMLLDNLGLHPDTERLREDCWMGISDTKTAATEEMWNSGEYAWYNQAGSAVCKVGFEKNEEGGRYNNFSLIAGGEDHSYRIYNDIDLQPQRIDIQIVVIDNETKRVICAPGFVMKDRLWSYTAP